MTATALVLEDYRRLVRRELPLPEIGDDDALLRVEACGLCGTDHEVYTGRMRWPVGFVPGHETVGVLERLGPSAAARWGVRQGDRVAVSNRRACRKCGQCAAGDLAKCARFGPWTSYGMERVTVAPGLWGGYASHHYLAPESVVHRVPDVLDPVTATLFNPLAGGHTWAVQVPGTRTGEVVAVLGPGMRGICAAAAAKAAGARHVLLTGFGRRDEPRLRAALTFGADQVVDTAQEDPVTALRQTTGGLADVVVDATANAPAAFGQAISLAGLGGRVIYAGIRGEGVIASCEPDLIVSRELRLLGVRGVATGSHQQALRMLAEGRFPFASLSRTVAGYDDLPRLLLTMAGETTEVPPMHAVFTPSETAK